VIVVDTPPRTVVFRKEAWNDNSAVVVLAVALDNPVRAPWFVQTSGALVVHNSHRTTVRPVTVLALLRLLAA
jgi:hypothetical protein